MKRVTLVIGLAVLTAASAWATDLNPEGGNACGAGAINGAPSNTHGEDQFAKIYENLNAKLGDGEIVED